MDAHVSRIVRAAATVPGFSTMMGCAPGSCQEELYETNATSSEHRALARDLAADSVVMLKNNEVLPLTGSKIAVVGGACAAVHDAETLMKRWDLGDYYVVGGSGRVVAARITSVLDALRADGADIVGVSGDDLDAALAAAAGADVVVACGGAATTEAADRDSLRLDNHDFLTALVAGVEDTPVVLVALAPGAVVLPQADAAAAALVCFLCGEATGLAIADVLLGRKEPGRRTAARDHPADRGGDGTALRGRRLPVHRGRARRLPRYRSGRRALSVRPRPRLRDLRARGARGYRRGRHRGAAPRRRSRRLGSGAGLRLEPSRLLAFEKRFLDEGDEDVVSLRFHGSVSEVAVGFSSGEATTYAVQGGAGAGFRRDLNWWVLVIGPPILVFSIIGWLLFRDRKRRRAEEATAVERRPALARADGDVPARRLGRGRRVLLDTAGRGEAAVCLVACSNAAISPSSADADPVRHGRRVAQ